MAVPALAVSDLFSIINSQSKETGNKELYKISDYVIAKDIDIPYGAVITTSQENIKKFHHPDLENAIKINKEYKDKKAQEKENK